jgi:hypothetical protein
MWPSGEAEVCKTFYDGSNPSITTVAGKQSLSTGDVSTSPFLLALRFSDTKDECDKRKLYH